MVSFFRFVILIIKSQRHKSLKLVNFKRQKSIKKICSLLINSVTYNKTYFIHEARIYKTQRTHHFKVKVGNKTLSLKIH